MVGNLPDFGDDCFHLNNQHLAISWVYPRGQAILPQTTFLTLDILVKKEGNLSEILQLSSQSIASETYDVAGKIHSLELHALSAEPTVRLSPNPATDFVTIQLDSPTAGEGLLQLVNAQGQIMVENTISYPLGSSSLALPLPASMTGLVYVLLNGTGVGKLILER